MIDCSHTNKGNNSNYQFKTTAIRLVVFYFIQTKITRESYTICNIYPFFILFNINL